MQMPARGGKLTHRDTVGVSLWLWSPSLADMHTGNTESCKDGQTNAKPDDQFRRKPELAGKTDLGKYVPTSIPIGIPTP